MAKFLQYTLVLTDSTWGTKKISIDRYLTHPLGSTVECQSFETDSKGSSYEIIGIVISIVYVKIIESQSEIKMFRWKVDIENRGRSVDR